MKNVVLKITRSELCNLIIACTSVQHYLTNGSETSMKKWKDLHDKLQEQLDKFDSERGA